MIYESDEQMVRDMTAALIEGHLDSGNCLDTSPSDDPRNVLADAVEAYQCHCLDRDPECDLRLAREQLSALYREAKKAADARWDAAMLLLGVG